MIINPSGEHSLPSRGTQDGGAGSQRPTDGQEITDPRDELLDLCDQGYYRVVRFVMRLGATIDDAEKTAQEAFVEAWEYVTKQPDEWTKTADPRKWVIASAYRKYMRRVTAEQQPFAPDPPAQGDTGGDPLAGCEGLTLETLLVLDALRNLHPLHRAVLAFHMEGFSEPEITAQLGLKDDQTTCRLVKKARSTLARELAGCKGQERRNP